MDVRDAPDPQGKRPAELDRTEIDHRQPLADLRQAAGMLVAKRSMRQALQPRLDRLRNVSSLLFRRRRDAGHRLAVPGGNRHGVADREDFGMSLYGQVRFDLPPPGPLPPPPHPFARPPSPPPPPPD